MLPTLLAVISSLGAASATGNPATRATLPPGCGNELPRGIEPGVSTNTTIVIAGVERQYRIHLPDNYDANNPVPLILSYHGRGKDMKFQEELSQFSNKSNNPDAIAVYPQGVPTAAGTHQWLGDISANETVNNDIQFTTELIANLSSTYCIDPARVYATGKSNGAGFTTLLACDPDASLQIAAFAPVSPAIYKGVLGAPEGEMPPCKPGRTPIPILEFHGFADGQIGYNGTSKRGETANIPEYMNDWATRNGFDAQENKTTDVCAGTDFPEAWKHTWGDGVVQHYNASNLGHTWPDTYPNADDGRQTCYDATPLIMDFFERFTL
ncbi:putative ferulic acid esterase protein [Lasiodiplodia theobromae]|uniref:Ferulic acid esterase n=1 Tax=Lasiodiplodia theobromae TaxID=45133 RepID=UPI0015C3B03C|nr:Ferulic acid esterase [Lasiodiplodia theobromae]KAF4535618.1 Ferulic acid esterase [Lasiodiplodia theobromae]KAF9638903.1 putative ferulic acid esterase protein [Lasiodiplodia theobromae]